MLPCSHAPKSLVPKTGLSFPMLGLALLGLAAALPASAQITVPTQNGDNARTGANAAETALTPANVNVNSFGKLFKISGLDANVNGQVLFVPNVVIGGVAHNVLYAYQSNNTDNSPSGLAAFDADTGAPLWRDSSADASPIIPPSATYTTPTPAIDAAAGIIYVLTKNDTDDTGLTRIHAIDLATGKEKPGSPVLIDRAQVNVPGMGDGNINGTIYFDGPAASSSRGSIFHDNDRAGLLLANGTIYAAFAHNSDSFPYHGWVVGYKYDGAKFTLAGKFCTTPNGGDGGIWMSGKGLTADSAGNIYCSVGNGKFDANTKGITSGTDYGMCYLKLSPTLQVLDWFAPYDQQSQSNGDLDLGNSGLVGIPGTNRMFGGATKFGSGFLLDSTRLGGFTPNGPDKAVLRLNALCSNDNVGQNPIAWDTGGLKHVYLWPSNSPVEQFTYDPGVGTFSPAGIARQNSGLTNGGSLAVSSNAGYNGILWTVGYNGVVYALDANDVSKPVLWSSSQNSTRDGLGGPGHFQFPTVANGKVYVPTGGRSIVAYGLLSPPAPSTAPVYRLYSNYYGDHFYTTNATEEQNAVANYGYSLEGIVGYAPVNATSDYALVYRTYNFNTAEHFYTTSPDERSAAGRAGYQYESVGFGTFAVPGTGRLPLYRLYYPGQKHFYTTSQSERDSLVQYGWSDEGILGYLRTNY